jgi:hypothetical protein
MAREKKPEHRVQMTAGKRRITFMLKSMNVPVTAKDILLAITAGIFIPQPGKSN